MQMDSISNREPTKEKNTETSKRMWKEWKRLGWKITGAIALFAALTLPDSNRNTFGGQLITTGITTLIEADLVDEAFATEQLLLEEESKEGNVHYSPYLEILQNAVAEFSAKHPDTPVRWERNEEYFGDWDAASIILTPISEQDIEALLGVQTEDIVGTLPLQHLASFQHNALFRYMVQIIINRLPTEIKIIAANSYGFSPIITNSEVDDGSQAVQFERVQTFYDEIKSDLERLYADQEDETPLLQHAVLSYFLERSNGDLNTAIATMAGFFKYMVREGVLNRTLEDLEWLRVHIQDQQNKRFALNEFPPFEQLTEEQRDGVISVWGVEYHTPNIVALLPSISPNIIRGLVYTEYRQGNHKVEEYKVVTDASTLDELDGIFAYLQSLSA